MFKLTSTTYNTRHYNEIKRYIDSQKNVLHVANEKNKFFFDSEIETSYINSNDDIEKVLNNKKIYDLIASKALSFSAITKLARLILFCRSG